MALRDGQHHILPILLENAAEAINEYGDEILEVCLRQRRNETIMLKMIKILSQFGALVTWDHTQYAKDEVMEAPSSQLHQPRTKE